MEKLKELINKCKSTVEVRCNPHRSYCDTIREYIEDDIDEIEQDVLNEMLKTDTLICIQFYPHSSVGFFIVYHYDLDMAIDKALSLLKE